MEKIFEQIINTFDQGIATDLRTKNTRKYAITKHFDTFTFPHKLVPRYRTEAQEPFDPADNNIVKFWYGEYEGSYRLFGLMTGIGNSHAVVGVLNTEALDPFAETWGSTVNGESSRNRNEDVFFEYKSYMYMFDSTMRYLMRADLTSIAGPAAFNDTYNDYSAAGTSVAQPVHHPSDDIAYFFRNNVVSSLNNTSFTAAALTLPSNMKITAACPYGNYLAIACVTKGTSHQKSIVFLWDRDSTLTTLKERIDFGDGSIVHLVTLENKLLAIMDVFASSSFYSLGLGKVVIKQANGVFGTTLNEIIIDALATQNSDQILERTSAVKDNKFYFPMQAPLNGDDRYGIWEMDSNGNLTLAYVISDVSEGASNTVFNGIAFVGQMLWVAHSDDGSVERLDDTKTFSTTLASVYESLIFNDGDAGSFKKLIGVEVMTEPLPTAGQVILKYRKDTDLNDATAWTTIFTNTTNSSISHGAINIESSGANLPEFSEVQFRIESTGGAVITGLRFKYQQVPKQLF